MAERRFYTAKVEGSIPLETTNMNFKKKTHRKRIWRKMFSPMNSVGEWSRMLHLSWMRDVVDKMNFKKNKELESWSQWQGTCLENRHAGNRLGVRVPYFPHFLSKFVETAFVWPYRITAQEESGVDILASLLNWQRRKILVSSNLTSSAHSWKIVVVLIMAEGQLNAVRRSKVIAEVGL